MIGGIDKSVSERPGVVEQPINLRRREGQVVGRRSLWARRRRDEARPLRGARLIIGAVIAIGGVRMMRGEVLNTGGVWAEVQGLGPSS